MREPGFDSFFVSEYPSVLRTVSVLLGDREAAEDIAQEAFYRTFVRWGRVSTYDKPGAFTRRVAIRLAGKAARKKKVDPAPQHTAPVDQGSDVREAVATLPLRQRAAIVLHHLEDRPVAEVATILGLSEGSVKTHLHRARKKLAVELAEEGSDVT